MSKRLHADRQLYLLERRLAWHELPLETREQLTRLFTTLCVEIVDRSHPNPQIQERCDERTED